MHMIPVSNEVESTNDHFGTHNSFRLGLAQEVRGLV